MNCLSVVCQQSPPKTIVAVDDRPTLSSNTLSDLKNSADTEIKERMPNTSFTLNNLGVTLAKEGQYEQAARILKQAAELSPELYQAHRNLSIVYEALKQPSDSLASARRAVEVAPKHPVALMQWCDVALSFSLRPKEAVLCFERLKAIEPLDLTTTGLYGIALYRMGEYDKAQQHLEKACIGPNENPDYLNVLGLTHFQKKSYKIAAEYFKRAVEIAPDRVTFRYNLGMAQIANKNRPGALSQYRLLKESDPKLAKKLYPLLYGHLLVSVEELKDRR
ncbi:MAG TPA: tetratricopeptide repeat protein [Pyrinomonadaceae bacterium]|nr:tetratricopeptide repeat protein [Pyrinomonadaceae bacterium]